MFTNIDNVINTEIPDPKLDPLLYDIVKIVKSTNIHSLYKNLNRNSLYVLNYSWSKWYLRLLSKDTHTTNNGYPQYRKQYSSDGSFTFEINGVKINNQWMVPYNPVLSRSFMTHINVELCNSVVYKVHKQVRK